MNYIEVDKCLLKWYVSSFLEPNDYCLMKRLISISNDDMGWGECFMRNNYEIIGTTKLSYKQLCNSRNKLSQLGLISFYQKNGNPNCKYEIHFDILTSNSFASPLPNLSKKSEAKVKVSQRFSQGGGIDNIKLNKTKQNKESVANATTPKSNLKETLESRKKQFYNQVAEFKETYPKEMLRKFYDYWSELNPSGTKMKFELQKTWELSKRLTTWSSREFNKPANFTKPTEQQITSSEKILS
ncbi:MAG TPA: hypothetical protein PKI86_08745 [Chitinophagales bacterium]|nr:hypothetical protein [Chitinophagales bacterium]